MRTLAVLLTATCLSAAATDAGLVVDVKLGYLAAPTRHYSTDTYFEQVSTGGGGSATVARLGFFPDDGTSNGPGLRFATALSGRTRLTWYADAAVELLLDDQDGLDYGRKEILVGGGLQFTLTGRLALRAGVELGYADLDFSSRDWLGNYYEYDGSGESRSLKIALEQGFAKHVIGISLRGAHRSEEIDNPGNHVTYDYDHVEALFEIGFRL